MAYLLIMADDLTGAIDTGVQLAKLGTSTHVMTDRSLEFSAQAQACDVLVINAQTRHCDPRQAFETVQSMTRAAVQAKIGVIYKKTDSALRGNIGAELSGLLSACPGQTVYFASAFPALGRYTQKGRQLIDGVPVDETVFGKDPFDPALDSYIPSLIARQSDAPVLLVDEQQAVPPAQPGAIMAFDATSDERLLQIAQALSPRKDQGTLLLAGCAGFAQQLGHILDFPTCDREISVDGRAEVLVVSGSLNPITAAQIDFAKQNGFSHIVLNAHQRLSGVANDPEGEAFVKSILSLYRQSGRVIVEASGEANGRAQGVEDELNIEQGEMIASNVGKLIARLVAGGFDGTVVVTGGDTLKGVLNGLNSHQIRPICEIEPGVALTAVQLEQRELYMVTKSGGFGSKQVFSNIYAFIGNHNRQQQARPALTAERKYQA